MEEYMTFGRIDQTAHVYTQSNRREKSFSCPIEMIVLNKYLLHDSRHRVEPKLREHTCRDIA
jgi:hypothetical protein